MFKDKEAKTHEKQSTDEATESATEEIINDLKDFLAEAADEDPTATLAYGSTEYTFDSLVELQRIVCRHMAPQQTLRRKIVHLVWGTCCLGMGVYMVSHGYNAILAMLLIVPGVISMLQYVFFYQMQNKIK